MTYLQFEVNKCYRTRDGRKATVLLIRPGYMVGEIEGREHPMIWTTGGGVFCEPVQGGCDIVAEWREPARVRVTMARHRQTESLHVFTQKDLFAEWHEIYEILDTFELVEGKGRVGI